MVIPTVAALDGATDLRRQRRSWDPAVIEVHRIGFNALHEPLDRLRQAALTVARRQGIDGLRRLLPRLYLELWARPRYHILRETAQSLARVRAARVHFVATARYGPTRTVGRVRTSGVERVADRMLDRPHTMATGRRWSWQDRFTPRDVWILWRFWATLAEWTKRRDADALRAAAAEPLALWAEKRKKRSKPENPLRPIQPKLDPRNKTIAYPMTDATEVELVDAALDQVVVARGQYFAEVGMRDLLQHVDTAAARYALGQSGVIVGWRWTLSPAHEIKDECDDFADADVGHPAGRGVYWDAMFPQTHPNDWCALSPEYADEEDVADPTWSPPEPDAGYVDRVTSLIETARPGQRILEPMAAF